MLLGGSGGMLPREILKIWAHRNAISCILSHFRASFMVYLWDNFKLISGNNKNRQREFPFFFGSDYETC